MVSTLQAACNESEKVSGAACWCVCETRRAPGGFLVLLHPRVSPIWPDRKTDRRCGRQRWISSNTNSR